MNFNEYTYCNSLTHYSRLKTWTVQIGNVPMGSEYPIRIQSMTNTPTLDTESTVNQCIKIIESGADYVRITTPTPKDAENLQNIKNELRQRGYQTPLIADVHYNPAVAEIAARIVEKVRINPGNYADKKKFDKLEYTDNEYLAEVEKIREKFVPLLNICKEHGTALRIGTNHGSLSDRIMSRYGDTPLGMVEATMEFLRICKDENFLNVVISLKASNTRIMVQAYRLMVNKMRNEEMYFPLHLGVTEAGDGEDGRIKSAIGIGTLLNDGIGDTIRVSLTESPEKEIPVAKKLIRYIESKQNHSPIFIHKDLSIKAINPFEYEKQISESVVNIGGNNSVVVVSDLSKVHDFTEVSLQKLGYINKIPQNQATDYLFLNHYPTIELPKELKIILPYSTWSASQKNAFPIFDLKTFFAAGIQKSNQLNFVTLKNDDIERESIKLLNQDKTVVLVLQTTNTNGSSEQRYLLQTLLSLDNQRPTIIQREYSETNTENLQLQCGLDFGSLVIDGFGDGIWIKNEQNNLSLSFCILQGSRVRMSKTEYISCPSCGRTLFDLEEVTKQIKEQTNHLKDLKIAIMGCVVNGLGEMADADYGYVGSSADKVNLYKNQTLVKRGISADKAVNELIELIKENGDWK